MEAAHSEAGAQALMFALLLAQDDTLRASELENLRRETDATTFRITTELHREIADLHSATKLALVDLSIPSLRRLSLGEYERFRHLVQHLMASDQQIDLFEFTLQKVIRRHLDVYYGKKDPLKIRYRRIDKLSQETAVLLTTLAALGHPDDNEAAAAAFRKGASQIEGQTGHDMAMLPPDQCGLAQIDEALDRFAEATPLVKKRLLYAGGKAVMHDGKITSDEAELIRAIADAIGCPIPPFVQANYQA